MDQLLRERGKPVEYVPRLPVSFDHETGQLWADWRRHRQRFPMLAAWLDRWASGALERWSVER